MSARTLAAEPDTTGELDHIRSGVAGPRSVEQQLRPPEHSPGQQLLEQLAATPPGESRSRLRAAAIETWLPLAEQLARRYAGRGEPLDDIIQTASVGLIKAVDRYQPDRGRDFVAFAVPTVLGEIRRHFRDRTWQLRVPRRLQELRLAIRDASDTLAQELGHQPTPGELADDLQVSKEEIVEGMGAARAYATLSLEATVSTGTDAGTELGELVGEEDADLAFVELRMTLAPALARLPEREQRILCMRFYGNMTQTEIAEQVGVSQMHVSRLLSRSLLMLREVITEDDDDGHPA
jgi:RNA polymerase sigma-B factor